MKCEWCEDDMDPFDYGGGLRHCSSDCRNEHTRFAVELMDARLEGEEPPTKEEFMSRRQRARKWTPDTMQDRIHELTEAAE